MRMTRITGERGRRGRRFRGHATGAAVLVVAVRKAATSRRLACTLAISAIFAGLAVTPASAQDPGRTENRFIYICKKAAPGSGVTGTFTFTVVDPSTDPVKDPAQVTHIIQVPVGGCSGAIGISRRDGATITETPANGTFVSKIQVGPDTAVTPKFSPTITVGDADGTSDSGGPGMPGAPGTITFTNNTFTGVLGLGPATGDVTNLPNSVCPKNFWSMDLKTGQQIGSLPPGSGIVPGTTSNNQAVTKLDFSPIPGIECRQANIVVEYEGTPSGWTVNIGDSLTNNGFGGGSGSPGKACAEVQVLNSVATHYRDCGGSGVLPLSPPLVPSPLSLKDGALKFVVKNDYLSVGQPFANSTGTGTSFHIPDAGLPDPDGSKIFAAFNRVISGPGDRVGTGARRVMITME